MGDRRVTLVVRYEASVEGNYCGRNCEMIGPYSLVRRCLVFGPLEEVPVSGGATEYRLKRHASCVAAEFASLESSRLEQIASVPAVIEWWDEVELEPSDKVEP